MTPFLFGVLDRLHKLDTASHFLSTGGFIHRPRTATTMLRAATPPANCQELIRAKRPGFPEGLQVRCRPRWMAVGAFRHEAALGKRKTKKKPHRVSRGVESP